MPARTAKRTTKKGKSPDKGASASLGKYRAKRNFTKTPEPDSVGLVSGGSQQFVVHMHDASRLHYDLRLEFDGVLKSWAVTRGPSLDPKVKRLAVRVEDHPMSYVEFEDVIPKGQYGAGPMIVWDRGSWVPMDDARKQYEKGQIKFRLDGEKLSGGWTLVQLKGRDEDGKNWLLIKERDIFAKGEAEGIVTDEEPSSVISGLTVDELAASTVPKAPRPQRRAKKIAVAKIKGAQKATAVKAPKPMLATSVDQAPEGDMWLHEIKFDGYRTLCRIDAGETKLFTRNGHDWTYRYPFIADAFEALSCRSAIIDGEVCVLDRQGRTSFSALQDALGDGHSEQLVYYAFDLVHLDGYDLKDVPLKKRKETLESLIAPLIHDTSPIQFSEHLVGNGPAFFDQASRMGLEGITSKKATASYIPGRSKSWLKTKCVLSDDFLVIGYSETAAAGGLSALLVAEDGRNGLTYVGKVGTGFTAQSALQLRETLSEVARDAPLFAFETKEKLGKVTWTEPRFLAEVQYRARTGEGRLRAAAFKGLREDQSISASAMAEPMPNLVSDADLAAIWVTNPDRVMFGDGGPTKLDLVLYYARIGNWMLPELINRPVTLVRCPTGKLDDTFYQRHANEGMVENVLLINIPSNKAEEREDYLYVKDAKGLFALSQFGVIEFHPWGCRVDKLERPDRLVFDLDPDEGLEWRDVVDAAHHIHEELSELGLAAFVRTTGGKGLHLVVPVERCTSWSKFKDFAQAFVEALAKREPRRYTASVAKSARRGKIFIDYIRNVRGATAVGSYSLRARPGAPAATPLEWSELSSVEDPRDFDYLTVPERMATIVADPWRGIEDSSQRITNDMVQKLRIHK